MSTLFKVLLGVVIGIVVTHHFAEEPARQRDDAIAKARRIVDSPDPIGPMTAKDWMRNAEEALRELRQVGVADDYTANQLIERIEKVRKLIN